MYDILQLNDMLVPELRELADSLGVDGFKKLNKQELVYTILEPMAPIAVTFLMKCPSPVPT